MIGKGNTHLWFVVYRDGYGSCVQFLRALRVLKLLCELDRVKVEERLERCWRIQKVGKHTFFNPLNGAECSTWRNCTWKTDPSFWNQYGTYLQHGHRIHVWYQLRERSFELDVPAQFRAHIERQSPHFQTWTRTPSRLFAFLNWQHKSHKSEWRVKQKTSLSNVTSEKCSREMTGTKLLTKLSHSNPIYK